MHDLTINLSNTLQHQHQKNTWTLVTQKAWPDLPSPGCTGPWGEIYTRHNPGAVLVTLASETVRSAREIIQNDTRKG